MGDAGERENVRAGVKGRWRYWKNIELLPGERGYVRLIIHDSVIKKKIAVFVRHTFVYFQHRAQFCEVGKCYCGNPVSGTELRSVHPGQDPGEASRPWRGDLRWTRASGEGPPPGGGGPGRERT